MRTESETLERIGHWQDVLTRALEETTSAQEKQRLEQELAELQQARVDVRQMSEEQAARLRSRLSADPLAWVNHKPERIAPS